MITRIIHNEKLQEWIDKKVQEIIEFAGPGSEFDAIGNFIDDYVSYCPGERLKAIDQQDLLHHMFDTGVSLQRKEYHLFFVQISGHNFYFGSKNRLTVKKQISKAFQGYMAECKPIDSEPTEEEKLNVLLDEIRASFISDPKGQTDQEADWCTRIDKIRGK